MAAIKGDVLGIARIAAIMASKKAADLIPLCHPIALTRVAVDFELLEADSAVRIEVTAECSGQTGVEMEALTAANVGLLTIYDMCKAVDRGMVIEACGCWRKRAARAGIGGWKADGPRRAANKSLTLYAVYTLWFQEELP